jgi:hypothetical protein
MQVPDMPHGSMQVLDMLNSFSYFVTCMRGYAAIIRNAVELPDYLITSIDHAFYPSFFIYANFELRLLNNCSQIGLAR